ncbi:MAG: DUF2997 domain-containing protein [Planctomycetota bacterium]|jgi:hypothetical protein|nr:DUF2997 domain-containing protein [Planctomycetota bacterium]
MEAHEFDIAIGADGKVSVQVRGTRGPVCEKYAGLFREILPGEMTLERTADYYAPPGEVDLDLRQGL